MSFASNLRDTLDMRGMEIKQLASKTGISKNTIDNYLSGQKSLPNAENAVLIAKALNVSVEFLVTGKNTVEANISLLPISKQKVISDILLLDETDTAAVTALVGELKKRNPLPSASKADFKNALRNFLSEQEREGKSECIITSGELHRIVGGYPGKNHRMPVCCSVMNEFFNAKTDSILYSPSKGMGATLTIKYALPRQYDK